MTRTISTKGSGYAGGIVEQKGIAFKLQGTIITKGGGEEGERRDTAHD